MIIILTFNKLNSYNIFNFNLVERDNEGMSILFGTHLNEVLLDFIGWYIDELIKESGKKITNN
ncbi:hypothetical protein [Tenacibaculum sp. C7A-26P2]|uniref:hypothetical protein n=1 Tax=Tenacibaculum sp. C7A-26P2 TaxID=3447504 RepID=UPI003F82982E